MTGISQSLSIRPLKLWESYSRREAHDVFEPDTAFTPQAGTWGLQGIVRLAESPGDHIFFVTFGASQGTHSFVEEISKDGVLTWQSQPQQRLNQPRIQQFIGHDDRVNTIHLFLRTSSENDYTYFGPLGYLDHDTTREAPVHFTWQLMEWPPPPEVLSDLGIRLTPPSEPMAAVATKLHTLTETPPPNFAPRSAGGGMSLGRRAILPGQDARNRKLGHAGELLALQHERERLELAGRKDLAAQVVHVAVVEGDSAGYDIRSFDADGTTRHIEVKTTAGPASNAFYVTPNEVNFSSEHPDTYVLMRLYGYATDTDSANYYETQGPILSSFSLAPTEYRARLGSVDVPATQGR